MAQFEECLSLPDFSVIRDFLECPSCLQIYTVPYKAQCGHKFCECCIYSMIRNNERKCSIDGKRIDPEKAKIDTELQKHLDSIHVACPLTNNGCHWNGKVKDLEGHKRSCPYNEIHCPKGCGMKVKKKDLANHAMTGCDKKLTRCKKCFIEMNSDQLKEHRCPCEKYPCPNECGKRDMTLDELSIHRDPNNGSCHAIKVSCKFKDTGCNFRGRKKDVDHHVQTNTEQHTELLCQSLKNMTEKQKETEKKMLEQTDQLKTIQSIFCEFTSLLKRYDGRQRELEEQFHIQNNLINEQAKQISVKDENIVKLEAKLNETTNMIDELRMSSQNGMLLWKINNFREKLNKALSQKSYSIYSPAFYTSKFGYKLCAQLFPAGSGDNGGRFMSIYFHLMPTEHDDVLRWPFSYKISFTLLDQAENADEAMNISYTITPAANAANYQKPAQKMSEGRGCHQFVALNELESKNYIKNDNLFIKIKVIQKG